MTDPSVTKAFAAIGQISADWREGVERRMADFSRAVSDDDLARRVELSERVLAKIRQHEGDPCPICRRLSRDLEAHYDEKHGGEA